MNTVIVEGSRLSAPIRRRSLQQNRLYVVIVARCSSPSEKENVSELQNETENTL